MTTLTLQPDETDGYDTGIKNTEATTNFGTNVTILVGENNINTDKWRSLIKFDLSSIPSNAVITSVTLTLTISLDRSSNARDYKLYRVLRDWVEAQATWNVWSTGNNWTTAGCSSDGNDYDGTVWATTNFSATETIDAPKDFVLTSTGLEEFTKWVNGTNSNYGWLIKADTEANDLYAFHSSSATTESYRPKLTVEYTIGGNFQPAMILGL